MNKFPIYFKEFGDCMEGWFTYEGHEYKARLAKPFTEKDHEQFRYTAQCTLLYHPSYMKLKPGKQANEVINNIEFIYE